MDNNDKKKFSSIMWGMAEEFGGKISKEGMKLKFEALKTFSIDDISQAATKIIQNREKTFPPVPTVKEFINAIESQAPQITLRSQASTQADFVISCSRQGLNTVNFEDKITKRIMSSRWNYSEWSQSVLLDELKWFKKEFIESYESYSEADSCSYDYLDAPEKLKQLASGILKKI